MQTRSERDYSINREIQKFIKENDKKPSAIADKANIRRDTFSRIINSKRPIFADELIPIVNALGMPMERVIEAVQKGE